MQIVKGNFGGNNSENNNKRQGDVKRIQKFKKYYYTTGRNENINVQIIN